MIADVVPTSTWYMVLAAVVFGVGAVGVMVRRNPLVMFMCVELMLNAVNLTFVAVANELDDINGQTAVFFVLVVAAAEVVVGLGIIVSIMRRRAGTTADDLTELTGLATAAISRSGPQSPADSAHDGNQNGPTGGADD